jgi:hypothetical protein
MVDREIYLEGFDKGEQFARGKPDTEVLERDS